MDRTETAAASTPALRCWIEGRRVYLELTASRLVSFPTSKYDSLAFATPTALGEVCLDPDGRTIRWNTLNEVIRVEDVLNHRFFHTPA